MASDKDKLADELEAFEQAEDAEAENRNIALEDLRFARLGEQWPDPIRKQRESEGRPVLTINKMPAFIRQVVNDSRQNRPQIKVKPVDDKADKATANVLEGLVRNIERTSKADVAYDTAVEFAVTMGWGYIRVGIDYEYDDTFDKCLKIERIANPFSVYGDPYATSMDGSDWNRCWVTELKTKEEFRAKYKGAQEVDWADLGYESLKLPWREGDEILVCESWHREESQREILQLNNGSIVGRKEYEAGQDIFMMAGIMPVNSRMARAYKITQRIMTGAEILEENEWQGQYLPVIPVYGEEINVEGKRYFRSLIHNAIDAQRMFNYWRPLALDTPVATPNGWSTIGALKVGDQVFDDSGKPANVIGKSPVHINRDCFEVTFDDGSKIVSDGQHPWVVEERGKRTSAGFEWVRRDITTAELTPGKHFIDVAKPLELADADLPVDPYVLGLWLGDGTSAAGRVTPGDDDVDEVMERVKSRGYEIGAVCDSNGTRHKMFTIVGLTSKLRAAGVLNHKHIPAAYLRASERQRWELLQGLMDTDGHINAKNGACGFTTTSQALADGFAELLRSLGIKAVSAKREGRASKVVNGENGLLPSIYFTFTAYANEPVFGLSRKVAKLGGRTEHRRRTKRHRIVSVVPVASVPVQCIAIDAPSHLFLAGEGMVPTHNTTATELVALAPRVPWIGEEGAFDADPNWLTANSQSHAFLQYQRGTQPPMRQPLDSGTAAGAMSEALAASDDMKAIIGMYDASLGMRSNETSGRAIMARQREGDVSTFHFIDNLARSIRQVGCVLLDLIPKVYDGQRIIRIIGPDDTEQNAKLGKMDENGPMPDGAERIYDLGLGRYDVAVDTGPSFTTRREESAQQMVELIRAYPDAAPLIGDIMVKALDWPQAEEIAERLKAMLPPQATGGMPPQLQQMIQQGQQRIQQLEAENGQMKADKGLEARKASIDAFKAETERLKELLPYLPPETLAAMGLQVNIQAMNTPDVAPGEMPPPGMMPVR